jgi:uncharacterized protein YdiU (UPF0061 family)
MQEKSRSDNLFQQLNNSLKQNEILEELVQKLRSAIQQDEIKYKNVFENLQKEDDKYQQDSSALQGEMEALATQLKQMIELNDSLSMELQRKNAELETAVLCLIRMARLYHSTSNWTQKYTESKDWVLRW